MNNWIVQSLIAMVTAAMADTSVVNLMKKGVSIQFIMLSLCIMAIPVFGFMIYKFGAGTVRISSTIILLVVLAGVFTFVSNLTQFVAGAKAPNAGMAFAIVGCKVVIIALISKFFLGGSLTSVQIIGMSLCVAGIAILSMGGT